MNATLDDPDPDPLILEHRTTQLLPTRKAICSSHRIRAPCYIDYTIVALGTDLSLLTILVGWSPISPDYSTFPSQWQSIAVVGYSWNSSTLCSFLGCIRPKIAGSIPLLTLVAAKKKSPCYRTFRHLVGFLSKLSKRLRLGRKSFHTCHKIQYLCVMSNHAGDRSIGTPRQKSMATKLDCALQQDGDILSFFDVNIIYDR